MAHTVMITQGATKIFCKKTTKEVSEFQMCIRLQYVRCYTPCQDGTLHYQFILNLKHKYGKIGKTKIGIKGKNNIGSLCVTRNLSTTLKTIEKLEAEHLSCQHPRMRQVLSNLGCPHNAHCIDLGPSGRC